MFVEKVLACECDGNIFQLIKIGQRKFIECIGCKARVELEHTRKRWDGNK